MSDPSVFIDKKQEKKLSKFWLVYYLIGFVGGLASLIWLLLIPSDPKNSLFLGYSSSRLLMIGLILFVSILLAGLGYGSWRKMDLFSNKFKPKSWSTVYIAAMITTVLLSLISWGALFVLRLYPDGQLLAYYERLKPLLIWVMGYSIVSVVWFAMLRFDFDWGRVKVSRAVVMPVALTCVGFFVSWLFVRITGLGITPDAVAWGPPGVPVYEWQIWGGLLLAVFVLAAGLRAITTNETGKERQGLGGWWKIHRLDIALVFVIWLAAVILWGQQSVPRSYFVIWPRVPNFEFYPYSDAANHDLPAQHIIIGNGFMGGKILKRPLLSVFFASLHLISGQDYEQMIFLQTLVLAVFPVALYLLGKALHSRSVGVLVAFFAIWREYNMIAATPYTGVSHSKVLLSDFPAALGVAVFSLLVVLWLKEPQRKMLMPLVAGGEMGLLMLVRPQSVLLVFVVLFAALFIYRNRWRSWMNASLLLFLGIFLSIAPWLWRNWQLTGKIVFEQQEQAGLFAQRFREDPGYAMPPRLDGETEDEYSERLVDETITYVKENPMVVLRFVSNHFMNNEIAAVLTLPIRDQFFDLDDAFFVRRAYWNEWDGSLRFGQAFLLIANLLIISLGIGLSFRRWKVLGLVPLLINLAYGLSNAVVRNSGWRYILPADWVGYFYYAIGWMEIIGFVLILFGLKSQRLSSVYASLSSRLTENAIFDKRKLVQGVLLGGVFLGIGCTIPLSEVVFPERYPLLPKEQLVEEVLSLEAVNSLEYRQEDIKQFMMQDEVVVVRGRMLYPVYYEANEGKPGFGWAAFTHRSFSRAAFMLVGPDPRSVLLKMDAAPAYLPDGGDVIVVGCQPGEYLDASLVIVLGEEEIVYGKEGSDVLSCLQIEE